MLATGTIAPYNFTTLCLGNSHRVEATSPDLRCPLATSKHNHKLQFLGKQRLQLYTAVSLELQHASRTKKIMAVPSGAESGSGFSFPFDPFSGGWNAWILGIVVSVIIPLSKDKWWPLLKLRGKGQEAKL
uniref:Uncharacterized protein n=1 Tax=Rhizophora mucronata TaxID=61149 RepID=A0A2P2KH15_RHIMU